MGGRDYLEHAIAADGGRSDSEALCARPRMSPPERRAVGAELAARGLVANGGRRRALLGVARAPAAHHRHAAAAGRPHQPAAV
jgi:hypothetical protein